MSSKPALVALWSVTHSTSMPDATTCSAKLVEGGRRIPRVHGVGVHVHPHPPGGLRLGEVGVAGDGLGGGLHRIKVGQRAAAVQPGPEETGGRRQAVRSTHSSCSGRTSTPDPCLWTATRNQPSASPLTGGFGAIDTAEPVDGLGAFSGRGRFLGDAIGWGAGHRPAAHARRRRRRRLSPALPCRHGARPAAEFSAEAAAWLAGRRRSPSARTAPCTCTAWSPPTPSARR